MFQAEGSDSAKALRQKRRLMWLELSELVGKGGHVLEGPMKESNVSHASGKPCGF